MAISSVLAPTPLVIALVKALAFEVNEIRTNFPWIDRRFREIRKDIGQFPSF
jgi:hypothetical protein